MSASDAAGLAGLEGLDVRFQAALGPLTSLKVGGSVTALVTAKGETELAKARAAARLAGLPFMVLGAGSNLLVPDGQTQAIVVRLSGAFRQIDELGDSRVRAGAAVKCGALARKLASVALQGFEFAAGIPGTLGGAVTMNAGYGKRSMADVLASARLLTRSGDILEAPVEELDLAYRQSRIPRTGEIVLAATLALAPGDTEAILAEIHAGDAHRARTQPLSSPSCGSVFKNPPGDHAGRLIEAAGCKGIRVGNAQVSSVHANFIVTSPGATAAQVMELIALVSHRVKEHAGVELSCEVRRLEECLEDCLEGAP